MDQIVSNLERKIASGLTELLGEDRVLTSEADRRFYSLDFSEQPGEMPLAVARPRSADDVPEIVRLAARDGVCVNTRGGGMSYTRGDVPTRPETIILDNTGLDRVIEINTQDRYVTLETGVTWEKLRAALAGTGYRVPYLGTLSGKFATVGGGLSQNATGMGKMTLAEHVLGLEVVIGDGRVVKTGSGAAHGTKPFYRYFGPDLTGIFLCDSGAFGIKTRVTLLLEPWPKTSFGCATFPDAVDLVAAQAEMCRSGLHTECFAFDGFFVDEYADLPKPPSDDTRAMVRRFLHDNPDKPRALWNLYRAWHPKGLKFLKGRPNAMYYIAEGPDQASAARARKALDRIVKKHRGELLPTTIPFGLRYGPFLNVGEIVANRHGEVNFPINAKFEASKAVDAMKAFRAFVADNREMLDRHGIRVACNSLLHGHFWGIEPVLFWKRPLGVYRGHYAPPTRHAAVGDIVDDAERNAAGIDFRYRMTKLFRSMGSLHVQWAKSYPFAEALEGTTTLDVLRDFKRLVDPQGTFNPGLLGLD